MADLIDNGYDSPAGRRADVAVADLVKNGRLGPASYRRPSGGTIVEGDRMKDALTDTVVRLIDASIRGEASREETARAAVTLLNGRDWHVPDLVLDDALDLLAMIDARHDGTWMNGRLVRGDYMYELDDLARTRDILVARGDGWSWESWPGSGFDVLGNVEFGLTTAGPGAVVADLAHVIPENRHRHVTCLYLPHQGKPDGRVGAYLWNRSAVWDCAELIHRAIPAGETAEIRGPSCRLGVVWVSDARHVPLVDVAYSDSCSIVSILHRGDEVPFDPVELGKRLQISDMDRPYSHGLAERVMTVMAPHAIVVAVSDDSPLQIQAFRLAGPEA